MTLYIYVTPSEPNRLEKVLTHEHKTTGELRDSSSVLNPTIRIARGQGITNFNYAYIPEFGRYYFITDITVLNTGLWELSLSVDPLMSFKEGIKKVTAICARSESTYNLYIPDDKFSTDNRALMRYQKLGEFNLYSYFINVLGGYGG